MAMDRPITVMIPSTSCGKPMMGMIEADVCSNDATGVVDMIVAIVVVVVVVDVDSTSCSSSSLSSSCKKEDLLLR
jgi:hypothetical protein